MTDPSPRPYRRIATEEAWAPQAMLDRWVRMLKDGSHNDPGFNSLWGFFGLSPTPRARNLFERLQDLDQRRLADMDAAGIDMAVLSLTCPGVQLFDADTAVALAIESNDEVAAAVRRHPTRFAALAAVAPHAPEASAREIERAVNQLGLKGVIVNSHTRGFYMDDPSCWAIFEACEALDVPLYLHPNTPSPQMVEPFLPRCLDAAIYGFAVETGLHALRLVVAGVFDRFPKLKLVLGHCGEGLPFWLYRIDFMHHGIASNNRSPGVKPLKKKPSDYLRENVWYTTSGMPWEPAITFCQHVIGQDRVMYAMDYPYQYVPEEVQMVDRLFVSPAVKKMFFETNAQALFKL
jgi:2,3-dihydroxybenzoate decarboxylase